jgi:predicted nucleotidyltransferase
MSERDTIQPRDHAYIQSFCRSALVAAYPAAYSADNRTELPLSIISSVFDRLILSIQPTPLELRNIDACEEQLKSVLRLNLDTVKFLVMGSHSRGTAIKNSDLDLLQVVRKKELQWGGSLVSSDTLLANVRKALESYARPEVRRDFVALVIQYKSGVKIDLVPGYYLRPGVDNMPVYQIPDGAGGWRETSPEAHNAYIKNQDEKTLGKLKKTVQIIKYWRQCRASFVRLDSFHLELYLAQSRICEGYKSISSCVAESIAALSMREARALRDPIGVSGLISASSTTSQKLSVAASLSTSADHARKGIVAEASGNSLEAKRQWDIVFNGGMSV